MRVKDIWDEFFVEQKVTVRKRINTVPNMITGAGILLTVLYIFMYVREWNTWLIPVVVALVVLSDLFDGFAARRLNQHSVLGKDIDPLRDRLLELAVVGNIVWVDASGVNILFAVCICFVELLIFYVKRSVKKENNSGGFVHTAGKVRLAVHMACASIFIASTYWASLWSFFTPGWTASIMNTVFLVVMLLASEAALIAYSRK